jgi:RND family efflux transporter MFP subunit
MADSTPNLRDLRIDDGARREPGDVRRRRRLRIVLIVLLASGVLAFILRGGSAAKVTTAEVEKVIQTGPNSVLQASGYVTARRKATVSSKFTGKVVEVLVEEGMKVQEGQVLARLDDALLRRQVDLDEARLTSARSNLREIEVRLAEAELNQRRSQELVSSGVAPQSELDTDRAASDSLKARLLAARDEVEVAERGVALVREQLSDAVIRAPFTGVAVSKDAQPGEMISPVSAGGGFTRTGICTLVDMGSLEIEVDVNEAYINRVREQQGIEAVLDAYPDWKIPGHVITTVPTADRQRATVTVRVGFDQLDPRILPDMGVKVAFLQTAEQAAAAPQNKLRVPCKAIVTTEGGSAVFVVVGDKVEKRTVKTIGAASGELCEVSEGVAPGEQVVAEASPKLEDGARVRVVEK